MIKLTHLATLLVLSSIAAPARAQMTLEKRGGAVPGPTVFSLEGNAQAPFFLLFSDNEQPTTLAPGVELGIDLFFLQVTSEISLFTGLLDGNGAAEVTIPIPFEPLLVGQALTFQSFELAPLGNVSNIARVTFQEPGTFAPTLDGVSTPLVTGKAFPQSDGSVLFLGGSGPIVQSYDPNLEEFSAAGLVPSGNILATQAQLADGTILVCGGLGLTGQPTDEAFVFDPATGQSTAVGSMGTPRAGHASATLDDGRVFVVGGAQSFDFMDLLAFLNGVLSTSEIYDPGTQTFSPGPAMLERRLFHTATKLGNGQVLVAGGLSVLPIVNIPLVTPTAQAYNPQTNAFGLPALMAEGRMLHSAVALPNGDALLAGGVTIDFATFLMTGDPLDLALESVDDALTYTPGFFGGFSPAMALTEGTLLPSIALLPNGGALIAGGFLVRISGQVGNIVFEPLTTAHVFDGASSITRTGDLLMARVGAVASSLNDGTVLIVGGGPIQSEVYQPR